MTDKKPQIIGVDLCKKCFEKTDDISLITGICWGCYRFNLGYEQGKLEAFLAKKTLEKNNEGLTKVRHNHLTVDSAYNDGIRIGQEQGKKELVELFEDKFLWKKYRNDGEELFREVHKWLKSQLSKKHVLSEVSSQESSKEGEKR